MVIDWSDTNSWGFVLVLVYAFLASPVISVAAAAALARSGWARSAWWAGLLSMVLAFAQNVLYRLDIANMRGRFNEFYGEDAKWVHLVPVAVTLAMLVSYVFMGGGLVLPFASAMVTLAYFVRYVYASKSMVEMDPLLFRSASIVFGPGQLE